MADQRGDARADAALGEVAAVAAEHTWVNAVVRPVHLAVGLGEVFGGDSGGSHDVVEVRVRAGCTCVGVSYKGEDGVVPEILPELFVGESRFRFEEALGIVVSLAVAEKVHDGGAWRGGKRWGGKKLFVS